MAKSTEKAAFLLGCGFLLIVGGFSWGYLAKEMHLFPYKTITEVETNIREFVAGHESETTTTLEKINNDLGVKPNRYIKNGAPSTEQKYRDLVLEGINSRRDNPRILVKGTQPDYRVLAGAFDFDESFWGAILLNKKGELVHSWKLSGEIEGFSSESDVNKNLYGMAVLPDGSIIYTLQERGDGLIKRNFCSGLEWTVPGSFHHTVSPNESFSHFWTFEGSQKDVYTKLHYFDAKDGELVKVIDMADVYRANPDLYIFDLTKRGSGKKPDTPHPNDIEVLKPELAPEFQKFESGDLALSYRTTNTVIVINPESLKVKFWYFGAGDGAHDVDFQDDGTITLFNNSWRANWSELIPRYSSVVAIDPESNSHTVLYRGMHTKSTVK